MRNFIEENELSFEEGNRNTTVITLIGYAQFKKLTREALKTELSKEIRKDKFISEEIDRLWSYCSKNNYKNWWKSEEAKQRYTFI